jgi:hypothetical protein
MAETFDIMFSCFLSSMHFLKLMIITHDKESKSDNATQLYLRLRRSEYREGRNQLMVSQEQMPFMLLVMHTLPEMKDHKQYMM